MWQSLNKIIEKEKTLLFKTKSFSLSSLSPHTFFFSEQLSLSLFLTLLFLLLHSPLKPQQSFNLWCSFLPQIVKGEHFRGREVRGYEWDFEISEWYLKICRGGQETLGTSGGVLLPKTKLDQSRPNPGIVGQLENEVRKLRKPLIVMAAQLIRDRVEMECLEGAWETLEGNTRRRFRGTTRFTATSLVHPDEPARTLQRTVEWTAPWISFVDF
ncbi:hypothetical protein HKD37_09G025275 [Glycine soja]